MDKKERPRRPLTPCFLFREKKNSKGKPIGGAEAGEEWRNMTEEEKAPFIESYKKARSKYDKYLEEQGLPSKSSAKKTRFSKYNASRIKTICEDMNANKSVYKGLARTVEALITDISKIIGEQLKAEEGRVVNVDMKIGRAHV